MKKIRPEQYLKREKPKERTEGIKVPEKEWKTLEIIAKRVSGDFGMKVKLGPPFLEEFNPLTGKKEKIPYSAFENIEDRSITFNPLFILENPEKAKRTAAHEGAHRAITRGEHEIGLPKEQITKLSSPEYIGFHSFRNIGLEDPRVNNWDTKKFPGLIELNKKVYDEQLKGENTQFIAPEVNLIISKLGRYPRYAEGASELLRFWHKGRYSKKLKSEIQRFLQRTQEYATKYQQTLPPTEGGLTEEEVIEKARECFETYHEDIWPEVKKLVEMDLKTEQSRQMLKDFRKIQKELDRKRKEMKEIKARGDTEKQEELQKEIEELEGQLDAFNELPEDVKKELQEQIDKAIRETSEKLNKEIEEKQKQIEEAKERQEELDKEIKNLEEKLKEAGGKEKEELEKQLQEKKTEKLAQEMKQKQSEQELKDIQNTLEQIQSGQEMPYPEDKLSEKTKQELEKLFQKLPHSKKEEYRQKAQKELEDFEDTVNKELEGKLNEDKPESHKERREREKKERITEEAREKEKAERKEIEKKLEEIRREKMTEYDKAYEEVSDIINSLYTRLKRFFLPERHPKWRKGYPTGQRVSLEKAMQAEADPRYLEKIWERKTIPSKKNYLFSILVDLSASMNDYGKDPTKLRETFKTVVILSEVLDKLGIDFEVIGFSTAFLNDVKKYKNFSGKFGRLTQEDRKRMVEILYDVKSNAFTPTSTATAYASKELQKQAKQIGSKYNFLINLTDGKPNRTSIEDPEEQRKTKEAIEEAQGLGQKLIGIGIGKPDQIYYVKNFYKAAIIEENVKKLPEAFADLLEDMIRHPEKY